jgi:hypothetical protein
VILILPIWLWLALIAAAAAVSLVMWTRKAVLTDPRSATAVRQGVAIADATLDRHCMLSVARHEMTAPDRMTSAQLLAPLEFSYARDQARTPISVVLSDRTLGVCYKRGSARQFASFVIKRDDISAANIFDSAAGRSCRIETSHGGKLDLVLQDDEDCRILLAWARDAGSHRAVV